MEVLERERQRNKAGGSGGLGGNSGGNPNDMTGGPGGMGKKSSSTSQLSAAGNVKCDAYPSHVNHWMVLIKSNIVYFKSF